MARTEAILISCPVIDWESFVNKVAASTGHIVSSGIDGSGLALKIHAKFLAALGQFKHGSTIHPNSSIKNPDIYRHLNFSFLIHSSNTIIFRLSEFNISILIIKAKQGRLVVATGTLEQWLDVTAAKGLQEIGILIWRQLNYLGLTQALLLT